MITTIHKTKPLQNIIYALSFWSAFISFLREIRSRKLFTGNLVRFLRIFLVHKFPCLKRNCSENASFVEILIWEEKKWECSTYPVLKHTKKSETTLHFKYTIRLEKQKKRSQQNDFFINLISILPFLQRQLIYQHLKTGISVHFGIKMYLKNTLKCQNFLQSSRTIWCWGLRGTELFSALQDQ